MTDGEMGQGMDDIVQQSRNQQDPSSDPHCHRFHQIPSFQSLLAHERGRTMPGILSGYNLGGRGRKYRKKMPANQGVADERYMQHDTRSSRINSKTKRPRSEIREMQCQTTAVERRDVRWKGGEPCGRGAWRGAWREQGCRQDSMPTPPCGKKTPWCAAVV